MTTIVVLQLASLLVQNIKSGTPMGMPPSPILLHMKILSCFTRQILPNNLEILQKPRRIAGKYMTVHSGPCNLIRRLSKYHFRLVCRNYPLAANVNLPFKSHSLIVFRKSEYFGDELNRADCRHQGNLLI